MVNFWDLLDDGARNFIQRTFEFWRGYRISLCEIDHFFYSMLIDKKNCQNVHKVLSHFKIDTTSIIKEIEDLYINSNRFDRSNQPSKPTISDDLKNSIKMSIPYINPRDLSIKGESVLTVDHLFLGLLISSSSKICTYLSDRGIESSVVIDYMASLDDCSVFDNFNSFIKIEDNDKVSNVGDSNDATDILDRTDNEVKSNDSFTNTKVKGPNKKTPLLNQICTDLTEFANKSKLGPIIGRTKEIEIVLEILCRKNKKNAILLGDPGVGKTAIAEGIAIALNSGRVPLPLKGKRLLQLNTVDLVAGTRYRGDFEERIKVLIMELTNNKDIILFIDEIHTIMGAGNGSGGLDVSNVLKPALARGDIQVIGATTQDEYQKYFMKDGALERRFQSINIKEPDDSDAIDILKGLKSSFEEYHSVVIEDKALEAAVRYSKQYMPEKYMPDKCIDLIDIAGARSNMNTMNLPEDMIKLHEDISNTVMLKNKAAKDEKFSEAARYHTKEKDLKSRLIKREKEYYTSLNNHKPNITDNDIAAIISRLTDIPTDKISEDESSMLLSMESNIKKRLIGQDKAVSSVSKAIRRARTDLHEKKRPIGSFLFMGPTGVGKTELARTLAIELFGKEDNLIKFDMSEYMETFDVSKLLGAPPGFVGYEEGGKLTEPVRKQPYSILLFDEIEKAHEDIYNVMLQILEDGVVTDAKGRKVYFNNCIIIMTSNIGAEEALNSNKLGFSEDKNKDMVDRIESIITKRAKMQFRPEFLNRLDDVIVFHPLEKEHLRIIVDHTISKLNDRIAHRKIKLSITDNMREQIISDGYDPKFGARPIKRAIQSLVEDYIADKLLKRVITDNMNVMLDYDKDKKETTHTSSIPPTNMRIPGVLSRYFGQLHNPNDIVVDDNFITSFNDILMHREDEFLIDGGDDID